MSNQQGGLHLSVTGATKEDIRYGIATGGYVMGHGAIGDPEPQPEPETRATTTRKPISAATKAKMAAAQLRRQAERRKTQEGVSETTSSAPATRRKPKTMTAGNTSA